MFILSVALPLYISRHLCGNSTRDLPLTMNRHFCIYYARMVQSKSISLHMVSMPYHVLIIHHPDFLCSALLKATPTRRRHC
jgi:hypothetical protein